MYLADRRYPQVFWSRCGWRLGLGEAVFFEGYAYNPPGKACVHQCTAWSMGLVTIFYICCSLNIRFLQTVLTLRTRDVRGAVSLPSHGPPRARLRRTASATPGAPRPASRLVAHVFARDKIAAQHHPNTQRAGRTTTPRRHALRNPHAPARCP